jgi:hypothetical protein
MKKVGSAKHTLDLDQNTVLPRWETAQLHGIKAAASLSGLEYD